MCYSIIAKKQGYNYCSLHPEIKNAHLESIEHRIKYKAPKAHKSEPLKLSKLTRDKWILLVGKTIMIRDELNIS